MIEICGEYDDYIRWYSAIIRIYDGDPEPFYEYHMYDERYQMLVDDHKPARYGTTMEAGVWEQIMNIPYDPKLYDHWIEVKHLKPDLAKKVVEMWDKYRAIYIEDFEKFYKFPESWRQYRRPTGKILEI